MKIIAMGQALFILLLLISCGKEQAPSESLSDAVPPAPTTQSKNASNDSFAKFNKNLPIYQYYQKIPYMRGVTNDPNNLIFNLQIELGYDVGNVKTLEKLSRSGIKIAGKIRQSMASKTKVYLGNLENYSRIEKDILELVNQIIAPNPKD
ncbi:MAG: hypothetical protein AAF975_09785 [Spirochaetota bacterium]